MEKKLLIVGAGGFIGGHIAAEAINRGYQTWAGVRASTSRRYLNLPGINFVVLDYDNVDSLARSLRQALPEGERWDYIIYNLGATKCANFSDFNKINCQYLQNFTAALYQADMVPDKFLYVSSLSALGPVDEQTYRPITLNDIPMPNTRYGVSKIKAETHLATLPANFPYIIFRPTGVYGPHELDYLMMIKLIGNHLDFGVGYKKQLLTFIYVDDLVNAMLDAVASPNTTRRTYIISEPRSYTQKEFRAIVAKEMGVKWVVPLKMPLWVLYAVSAVAEKWGVIRLKPSTLNTDKYRIMKQRNWQCDVSDAQRDFGFTAKFPLVEGIRATVRSLRQ